ncbi:NADH:ubiquinone oxidoreductase, subunit G, iron-sulfur binding protein [Desulfobulbus propionicus DSM 2032]|jgi:NADH-quinone oxidoreductase subunit G|uniref:NADH:ubiquinone oxidoreductase, subunit G, iron-sulfur binding protein n=1 Tax=Desulfobulbus propionicus (strain ATCC 33891 / DSM 2032 / VKM B-1956 / 1pr3) TaxID=577650 RepID=A0A7U3YMR1_DESPD|nr:2Fe-2S iron-sulfur cluster-binding protein [Desulfobulbus propionicus]ADW18205.1 NADH:ubiquinone oxidoreductase, subunit G, iron-sulfur binding protein [Desulfobulbus propionicus DSM 2032]
MADKVKLFVNGQEVEVESGKNLIDAIGAVGIEIPHLCYHPALGADGNCRMCLVGIEDGRPPLVPACKTRAVEGMKVQLDTDKIKKIQRDIMELELINHPIDCPICDQAGECKLQDYYMKYDGQKSRMTVKPVLKAKKMDFGCGVVHDQERCVLCARCVRFTRLITKTGELGIVNRTDAARVNIFPGRPLNNRYALNVVDLCPVGAMTSRDFRFKQRSWFLTKSKGICQGCSKGCNIFIDHNREKYKDDVIYRFRPRLNDKVNGYFICDDGRMSYKVENENRLNTALIAGKESGFNATIEALRREISQASKVVFLLSPNNSLEQMYALQQLAIASNAVVTGFCDGYSKAGDGDDFLIQDDKSANRASFTLLGIDSSRAGFDAAISGADLLISFQNDLSKSLTVAEFDQLLSSVKVAYVGSSLDGCAVKATIALPVASYTEDAGTLINVDQILQQYEIAVVKNTPAFNLIHVVNLLGGPVKDYHEARAEIMANVAALNGIDLEQVPGEGLALTDSEVSNVAA